MISVNLLFIFIAAVSFLGFIINALFDKFKITKIFPLILIGLLVGPVLGVVSTGPGSILESLTPFITSIAIAFILFDVGLNLNLFKLGKVFARATSFTLLLAFVTGLALSGIVYYLFGWNIIEALIFGFALAGPSSIIVPTIIKLANLSQDLKTTLLYESVVTDSIQLIIPIILFSLLLTQQITLTHIAVLVTDSIFGSILFGASLALGWLYILKKFKNYSKQFSWMLTITMVVATYGISQQVGFNGALTIFVFSLIFSNVGARKFRVSPRKGEALKTQYLLGEIFNRLFYFEEVKYVKNYQSEVEFFTSTFFFVYIGMLFSISGLDYNLLGGAAIITLVCLGLRYLSIPILRPFMPKDPEPYALSKGVAAFNIPRGLSSAIVATLPLTFGFVIPGFLEEIFLIILFTNLASTIGVFWVHRSSAKLHSQHSKIKLGKK
ncbi:MAG: cation:proton antiporter [Candidatus Micrarchaeota archaeon]|nr:cation:proton antiporter [Candidatus Micrarchaeota archaeon]